MVIRADISVLCVALNSLFPSIPSLMWAKDSCLCDSVIHPVTELTQLPVTWKLKRKPPSKPVLYWVITCIVFQSNLLNSHTNSSLFTNTKQTMWKRDQTLKGKETGCCVCHRFCWNACQGNPAKNLHRWCGTSLLLIYFIYEYLLAVVLLPLAQHYNTALDNAKKMLREYNNWALQNRNTISFFSWVLCVHMHIHNWSLTLSELTFKNFSFLLLIFLIWVAFDTLRVLYP